jgi:hypothetical protein
MTTQQPTNAQILDAVQQLNYRFDGVEDRLDGIEGRFDGFESRFDKLDASIEDLAISIADLAHMTAEEFDKVQKKIQHLDKAF